MGPILKTLLLLAGIVGLVILANGFPRFALLLKHPLTWVLLAALGFWLYRVRTRNLRRLNRVRDDDPPRLTSGGGGEAGLAPDDQDNTR